MEVVVRYERWIDPEPLPADAPVVHPDQLLSELLVRRGIRSPADAHDFLDGRARSAPDPFRLPNMEAAVHRIGRAIESGERIAIFGDYDADGVTATALLLRALRQAGGSHDRVVARLPRRSEGYGLNRDGIDELAAGGARLLIAVDCGSSDHDEVDYALAQGLDVVVLDHHQMADDGPRGAIVVSAKLPGAATEAYHELSAVGVAYLLVAGLARDGYFSGENDPEHELLDFVALGTIGDVSPMTGPNRALVREGLRRLRARPRAGLRALYRSARVEADAIASVTVAFKIVPRLNAAGRMGDPRVALDLLLTDDPLQAQVLASRLEALNDERKLRGQQVVAEAERQILARPDLESRGLLIVTGEGWTGGVLGIAAAKLTERFGRPVIVMNRDGETCRGSARSIPGFDINAALAAAGPLVGEHGGHNQAAGLTVRPADVEPLEAALSEAVFAEQIEVPIAPALRPDAVLPAPLLHIESARTLQALEPHGAGNEPPLLLVRDLRIRKYDTVGQDGSHLKLTVETGRGSAQVMVWGAADRSRQLLGLPRIDLALTLRVDRWNGQERLEAIAEDFRLAEAAVAVPHAPLAARF
jgi:single-stranded-DNA-specific exonuclease